MSALLAQAQQMQQKLWKPSNSSPTPRCTVRPAGAWSRSIVKGSGEVVAVQIDPKVVDPGDIETLQDLIVGAMADASKQVTKHGAGAAGGAGRRPGRRHRRAEPPTPVPEL